MVQISGKYQHVKNENFIEHLVAYGISEENAKKADALKPTLEVSLDGNKVSLKSDSGLNNASSTLILDEEVDEPMPMNITLKSTARLNGDTLTIVSKADSGKEGTRVYKFSDEELVLTMSSSDSSIPVAKRVYRKI